MESFFCWPSALEHGICPEAYLTKQHSIEENRFSLSQQISSANSRSQMQIASSLDVALSVHSPLSCWDFVRFLPCQVYDSWRVFASFLYNFICLFRVSFWVGEKKEYEMIRGFGGTRRREKNIIKVNCV